MGKGEKGKVREILIHMYQPDIATFEAIDLSLGGKLRRVRWRRVP